MIVEQGYHEPAPQPVVGRARYLIIGAVAVLAVAVGVVLGGVLVGGGATPLARAADYVPADAVMYAEARLDLPGAQRANLRSLLERFPLADTDAVLTDALAGTLDSALSDGGVPFDYSNDIAPWFDGTLAMAMLDYPLNADPEQFRLPAMVGLFGVRDAEAAGDLAATLRAEAEANGSAFTSTEHDGITIWSLVVEGDDFAMPMEGVGFAYALTDDQLMLANGAATIEAALDAVDGQSLADAGEVQRLLDALPEERSGAVVVNSAAMMAEMRTELEAAQPGLADALGAYLDAVPAVSVGAIGFADDALLVDAASELPDGPFAPENSSRSLAERVPADTILFADGSRIGPALEQGLVSLKATLALGPMGDDQLQELERFESALGAEIEEFVSWIGDGAVAAGSDDGTPWFGVLMQTDDPEAAARRLNQLGALAELAARESGMGTGVQVATGEIDGVEVTTISFGGLAAEAGLDDGMALQYALDGDVALLGVGERFVRTALTIDAGDSLAESNRFGTAVSRFGGTDNAGAFFLDLAGLRAAVEKIMPPDSGMGYAEIRPNLEPLDFVAGVTRVEGDRVVARLGLVLR